MMFFIFWKFFDDYRVFFSFFSSVFDVCGDFDNRYVRYDYVYIRKLRI